jgi:hypothetical protein
MAPHDSCYILPVFEACGRNGIVLTAEVILQAGQDLRQEAEKEPAFSQGSKRSQTRLTRRTVRRSISRLAPSEPGQDRRPGAQLVAPDA